jgi:hypothetical protein
MMIDLRNTKHKASTYRRILIPKDGALLPVRIRLLLVIADPFIEGCNYCGLRRNILIIEAEVNDDRAWGLFLPTLINICTVSFKPNLILRYTSDTTMRLLRLGPL